MNPNNETHRQRLSNAMEHWYRQLSQFRRNRRLLIEDYAGTDYGQRLALGTRHEIFVNLIFQTVEALSAALIYNDPRFSMHTHVHEHKEFAKRFEAALNSYVPTILLRDTIEECLRDAFFCMGICKIYLESSPQVMSELDPAMDPGMPWAGRVSLDNWVHDGTATNIRRARFMGDRYRMPLEMAKAEVRFDPVTRSKLEPRPLDDRRDKETLASEVTEGRGQAEAELEDGVDLVDVYLAHERLICTWPIREDFSLVNQKPLAVVDWDGDDTGPYRFLSFVPVPDNTMPSSPAQLLRPLFLLFNSLFKKLAIRGRSQKDVLPYAPGDEDDMARVLRAKDLQAVKVNNPEAINVLKMGGIDQSLTSFGYGVLELFKASAGNLDFLAGLGPNTETLGQDQMIAQQVNARLALSRNRMARFVSEVGADLAGLMFDDPLLEIQASREIPGVRDLPIDSTWLPPDEMPRPGSFRDYRIRVDPYSMEYVSPMVKLQRLRGTVASIMPFYELLMQGGVQFDARRYLELESELQDLPQLMDIFQFTHPPTPGLTGNGQNGSIRQNNAEPRETIRRNVSMGPTSQGRLNQAFTQQPHGSQNGQQNS